MQFYIYTIDTVTTWYEIAALLIASYWAFEKSLNQETCLKNNLHLMNIICSIKVLLVNVNEYLFSCSEHTE